LDRALNATGWTGVIAGLGWIAKDIGGRLSPDPDYWDCNSSYDYALNAIDTIAFLFLVPALVGLARAYKASVKAKRGLVGLSSAAGFAIAGISNLLEHCAEMDALGFPYVIGALLGILLLLLFSLALTRMRFIASWASWLLVAGTASGLLFANQGGFIIFGLAWIAVGSVIISSRLPRQLGG
jgi:hypothetical protein